MSTYLQRLVAHAANGRPAAAVVDASGKYTYGQLLRGVNEVQARLTSALKGRASGSGIAAQPRVAYLCGRNNQYVQAQVATWASGGIAVPMAENHPAEELQYVLEDSGASAVMTDAAFASKIAPVAEKLKLPLLEVPSLSNAEVGLSSSVLAPPAFDGSGAMLIYTSGTTGRPKGVLTTHPALEAQISALCSAWGWTQEDHIYGVLPLHHVHGVVAVLNCGLSSGATVELAPKFDAAATWAALTRPAAHPAGQLSLFMAVPTVYARLVELYDKQTPETQAAWSAALRAPASRLRLMVSGSAALPEPLALRWQQISGEQLLERYGMTEFAMAISNPLHGTRKLNSVGKPLPGYEVRLAHDGDAGAAGGKHLESGFVDVGELQVRGPGVFGVYWGRPEATAETFAEDGWFKTGDRAAVDAEGYYYIQGRLSADIIKSGGYKISALDIERVLLEHPEVAEIAVLGIPDAVYGEKVAAVILPKVAAGGAGAGGGEGEGEHPALSGPEGAAAFHAALKTFSASKLPPYKIPSVLKVVKDIPRNAMGKVNKKELRKALF